MAAPIGPCGEVLTVRKAAAALLTAIETFHRSLLSPDVNVVRSAMVDGANAIASTAVGAIRGRLLRGPSGVNMAASIGPRGEVATHSEAAAALFTIIATLHRSRLPRDVDVVLNPMEDVANSKGRRRPGHHDGIVCGPVVVVFVGSTLVGASVVGRNALVIAAVLVSVAVSFALAGVSAGEEVAGNAVSLSPKPVGI